MEMKSSSQALIQQAKEKINEMKLLVANDPYRLDYHIMPPVGLLNDPNGFVYFNGYYHLFYQWNPFATTHGAKFWGHVFSKDLVHWHQAEIALAPDQWYDKNGCYSGSAIVNKEKLYLFYTGNVKNEQGERESYQCLAISEDGIHFEKQGPIIHVPNGYTGHFRDPKVFRKDNTWYMVLGAQTMEKKGQVVLYTSPDLREWNFQGPIAGSDVGELYDFGYMWECPDLFQLNGADLLLVCPQGLSPQGMLYQNIFQSGYFAGEVDWKQHTFSHGDFVEMDRGFDFYAAQTTEAPDGRRLLVGWMGNAEEIGSIQPTENNGWIHCLTLPRVLEWKSGRLIQKPVKELEKLRQEEVRHVAVVVTEDELLLPKVHGSVFEVKVDVHAFQAKEFSIHFGESSFHYNIEKKIATFTRLKFSGEGKEIRQCTLEELESIRIFKDTSSVEIFLNDGEEVFTSRVFHDLNREEIYFHAEEGQVKLDVTKWNLKKVTEY